LTSLFTIINFHRGAILKKISIVGTVGLPAKYGGFETLAANLVGNLSNKFKITVFCSGKFYEDRSQYYDGARLKYINLNANGVQSIFYDVISILWSLFFADTILILGVSGAIIIPIIKLFSNKNIIVNIDGLEWKREKWNRFIRWFLRVSEKLAVRHSHVVIADNRVIQEYIKNTYHKESTLIAYGGDHIKKAELSNQLIEKFPFLEGRYALTICRIEPENNIHMILEAFRLYENLNLVVLGNWDIGTYSRQLRKQYGEVKNIFLLDGMYDNVTDKNQIRSGAYVYIHGHSAGGTSPALVEAMSLGMPVLSYDINYNKETTQEKAKYFGCEKQLVDLLESLSDMDLIYLGNEMFNIAQKNYSWELIAKKYVSIF